MLLLQVSLVETLGGDLPIRRSLQSATFSTQSAKLIDNVGPSKSVRFTGQADSEIGFRIVVGIFEEATNYYEGYLYEFMEGEGGEIKFSRNMRDGLIANWQSRMTMTINQSI